MKIFKYKINHGVTKLPEGSEVIHVGVQYGELFAWALVPEEYSIEYEAVHAFHTGEVCHEPAALHKGTFLLKNGAYVLHVFICPMGHSYS